MKKIILMAITIAAFLPGGEALSAVAERRAPQDRSEITLSFAPVVREVAPSVVNIYTRRTITRRSGHPFLDDPFFRQFFGEGFTMEGGGGLTREQVEGALGSGLIVQEDGLVVTNAHVIKGADAIKVVLGDGREFDATLSLLDEPSDLALLRMDTRGAKMPFATLKSSDDMEVGDLVLAIGNPFGVGQTVTSGIISALSRSSLDISNYNFFIQTDAAINPGNSGGPLVAMDGGVVGINTAIYSRSGGSLGIGFAIPSEMVRAVIAAEKSGGKARIQRPWLGVISQAVSSEMAESLGLSSPSGTLISALHPASPLKKAGAKLGDVIMSMNGKAIRNAEEMKFRMATLPLGEIVDVGLYRDGKERVLKVKTIAPPDEPPREETLLETGLFAGATVVNVNPAVIAEHDWLRHDDNGVVITEIRSPSVAARFLQPGDIIQRVNGIEIKTVQELKKAVNARVLGWNVIFSRDGQSQQIMVR